MPSARVHVGTSGWSYRDWVGPFYPEGTAASDYLGIYAERFRVVEVDSTFYGIPRRETVEKWAERTPETFRFVPKVPGTITHGSDDRRPDVERVLRDDAGDLERFLEALGPLGDRLGPLVFQFPYFRVGTFELPDFLERLGAVLGRLPDDVPAAVEVRNKTWVTGELLSLLESRRAGAVMIDHPYMPPPLHQLRMGMVTADFALIRLLGDRHEIEKTTKTWERTVVDRGRRIDDWAEVIERIGRDAGVLDIYAFSNNHFAGHAPSTCRALLDRLGAGGERR